MMPEDDDFVLGGDDSPAPGGDDDSGIIDESSLDPNLLTFLPDGNRVIVGLNSKAVPDELCIAGYRNQLLEYVDRNKCQGLAFELKGVKILPSGMIGLLVSLKKRNLEIELLNPVSDIIDVLRITRLLPMFKVVPAP